MKPGIVIVMILALVATGLCATGFVATAVFAPPAWASSATTAAIIQDASDGTINGHYTVAEVRAALVVVENDPAYSQYSDIQGVIESYLASLLAATPTPKPTTTHAATQPTTSATTAASPSTAYTGQLDYTGGQPLLLFGLGGALVGAGWALRRRTSATRP
jgi:hypothetical protein